jgi:hypothetical protein
MRPSNRGKAGSLSRGLIRAAFEPLEGRTFLAAPGDLAGDTLATAHNLGSVVGVTRTFEDEVGGADRNDYVRFRVKSPGYLKLDAEFSQAPAGPMNVQFFRDDDADGAIDPAEVIAQSTYEPGRKSISGQYPLAAGAYYVRFSSKNANVDRYTLTIYQASPLPETGGPTFKAALDISNRFPTGYHTASVIARGAADWYRFRIGRPFHTRMELRAPLEFNSPASDASRLGSALYLDRDGDGPEAAEEVHKSAWQSFGGGASRELRATLAPGTYYLKVTNQHSRDVVYDFEQAASVAGTRELDGSRLLTHDSGSYVTGLLNSGTKTDAYSFVLDRARLVTLRPFTHNTGARPIVDLIRDANLNGMVDKGEVIASAANGASLMTTVAAGIYHVRVRSPGDPVGYELALVVDQKQALTSMATAPFWQANEVSGGSKVARITGNVAKSHFYQFDVPLQGLMRASLVGLNGNVNLQLIRDADDDRQLDPGEILAQSTRSGTAADSATILLNQGHYFARVISAGGEPVRYQLDLNLAPTLAADRDPGNGFADAYPATLGRPYVDTMFGPDRRDYYLIPQLGARSIEILLQSIRGDANVELLVDRNANGVRDDGELIASSAKAGRATDRITTSLDPGYNYYIRIYRAGEANTVYEMTIR